jgi:drug/metabolite transporter (DMT)-like permease
MQTLATGARAGLAAALLFGAGTPLATLLVAGVNPIMLAGMLYCGAGVGLWLLRLVGRLPRVRLARSEWVPLAGAVVIGGMAGPVLLMFGLTHLPATASSLLLNAESVFTALVAWVVFREHVDARIAAGMASIAAGAVLITVSGGFSMGAVWPSCAVVAACLCWAIDNNLTRSVALNDATWLAAIKGSVAGPANVALALAVGAAVPPPSRMAAALVVGFFAYGLSLVLFIVALRHVGAARAGAYFAVAPFFGSALAVALGDTVTWWLATAAGLMAIGVWIHVTERHQHIHTHPAQRHTHWHTHDLHHDHEHTQSVPAGTWHRHEHIHTELVHKHDHYPDAHHRHRH